MNNLSNYLTYLNEDLILKKDCYCYILKYKEFGFEKIFYVGQKDLPFYGKSLFGFNLFDSSGHKPPAHFNISRIETVDNS